MWTVDHVKYFDMLKFLAPVVASLEYIQLPKVMTAIITYKLRNLLRGRH